MLKSLVGFFVSFSVADATRIVFDISSAGYFDGDFASTKANGRVVVSGYDDSGRGLHLAAFNPQTGALLSTGKFDTHADSRASQRLKSYLDRLSTGTIVAMSACDEHTYSAGDLKDYIKRRLGAQRSEYLTAGHEHRYYRANYIIVSAIGALRPFAEKASLARQGRVRIQYTLTLGTTSTITTTTATRTTTTTTSTTSSSTTTDTDTTATATTTTTTITATTTTTTLKICGPGEFLQVASSWSGQTCKACRYGTFREDEAHSEVECVPWKDCDDHEHRVEEASKVQNNICETIEECAEGEYQYRAPIAGRRNRQCKPITACLPGQYILTPATATQDQRCRRCDGTSASFDGGLCTTTTMTTTTATTSTRTRTTKTYTTRTRSTTTRSSTTSKTSTTVTTETTTTETTTTATMLEAKSVYIELDAGVLASMGKYVDDMISSDVGFTPTELAAAGFDPSEIAWAANNENTPLFSASDLAAAVPGMTASFLKEAGYGPNDVRAAGYSEGQMVTAGYDPSQIAASAAFAPKASTSGSSTTTIIVVLVVLLLVVGGAIFFVKMKAKQDDDSGPAISFENPMYDSTTDSVNGIGKVAGAAGNLSYESAYMDVPAHGGASSGYMDVNAFDKIGGASYMDVSPNAGATAAAAATYMDVSPNEIGGVAGESYMDVSPNAFDGSDEEI